MPEEWASRRSIARWVLPVLVGPSTAVTPAPRARTSRFGGAENETGISDRLGLPMATERAPGHMVPRAGAIRPGEDMTELSRPGRPRPRSYTVRCSTRTFRWNFQRPDSRDSVPYCNAGATPP